MIRQGLRSHGALSPLLSSGVLGVVTVVSVVGMLLLSGCGKTPATTPSREKPEKPGVEPPSAAPANPESKAWRTDQFCIMATQLRSATPVRRQVPGLTMDAAWLTAALAQVPELHSGDQATVGTCADVPKAGLVGVAVTLDYGGTAPGSKAGLIRADKITTGGRLYVSAIAHIERAGPKGKPEVAQSTVEASGPLVFSNAAGLKRRVRARLAVATALAVRRALGQLWIRHQTDADVRTTLTAVNPWRRAASLQEIGERGLVAATDVVEKATRDSRANIAVVACATLGRLGQARSVPVLVQALQTAPAEVADAALYALHDIGGVAASRAISAAATKHALPWIRLRAKALLDAGARND